jgi:hypothetical protein
MQAGVAHQQDGSDPAIRADLISAERFMEELCV